jgi:DNA-binding CsgD family transcriptional regulator
MLAEGMPSAEIRSKLRLSAHTVKNHLFHIYNKLGISNRAELLLYALASRDGPVRQDVPVEQSAA